MVKSIQGAINHPVAKYILWKYENWLNGQGKPGYKPMRFDNIEDPELEHRAGQKRGNKKGGTKEKSSWLWGIWWRL